MTRAIANILFIAFMFAVLCFSCAAIDELVN
jgi:hypothetical protein